MDIPLALITNGGSDVQRAKIERFGLAPYFAFILVEGEFGFGKPEKQVFQACLDKFAVEPSAAWMIGDDLQRDIGGAMSLGIKGIWVDWRLRGLPLNSPINPDLVISTLAELLDSQ
jgi:putative hydrolase of the HAD superfamily